MIMKSLIAASAVAATMAIATPITPAEAKVNVFVGIGGGGWGPGYGPGYGYGYGGYHPAPKPYWGISCGKGRNIVRWSGFKNVHAFDCGRPVFQYKAWKFGAPYRVRVSAAGHIIGVKPWF